MSENLYEEYLWAPIFNFTSFKEQKNLTLDSNIPWSLCAYTNTDNDEKEKYLGVSLRCNKDCYNNLWSCNASVRFTLKKFDSENKDDGFTMNFTKKFTRADNSIELPNFKKWEEMENSSNHFVEGNYAVVNCWIVVNSSEGFKKHVLQTFDEPKEYLTDVVLLVEGKKVHVGKQILALHSKYFETLFFSNFKENTEKEIPIEDVVHSEFVDLLNLIYPSNKQIDEDNLNHILKLADRFKFWFIIEQVEDFLIEMKDIDMVDKLIYAETYKLPFLQASCCQEIHTIEDVLDLTKHERYHELGVVTLSLLRQRLPELNEAS